MKIEVYIDDSSDLAKEVRGVYEEKKDTLGGGKNIGDMWFRLGQNGVLVTLNSFLGGLPTALSELGVSQVRITDAYQSDSPSPQGMYELDDASAIVNHDQRSSGFDLGSTLYGSVEIIAPTFEAAVGLYKAIRAKEVEPTVQWDGQKSSAETAEPAKIE